MTINIISQSDITDRCYWQISRMIQGHMTEMVYFHWSVMLHSSACRFVCLHIPKPQRCKLIIEDVTAVARTIWSLAKYNRCRDDLENISIFLSLYYFIHKITSHGTWCLKCWWLICLSNVTKILEVTICSRTRRGSMPIPSASKKNFARRNKTAVWGRGDMLRLFSKLRIWGPIDMKESKYMLNNEMIAFL